MAENAAKLRLDPPLRYATADDGPALALLINEASRGLALHLWRQAAGPGADIWAAGAVRQSARAAEGRWAVVDEGRGAVAGMMAGPTAADPVPPDLPALLRPLVELEALAPDALYVYALATLPEARGRGLGKRLLGVAEAIARAAGRPRLSLIVADDNAGARRLYHGLGYRQRASRAMVKDGWNGPGTAWLLLVKEPA